MNGIKALRNIMDKGIKYSNINLFPLPSCETDLTFRCLFRRDEKKKPRFTEYFILKEKK